jgi:putative hydrolase of the HAD superfamily
LIYGIPAGAVKNRKRTVVLQAVVFDLGGTLLHYHDPDSDEPQRPFRRITMVGVAALAHQLTEQGVSIEAAAFGEAVDHRIAESYRATMPDLLGASVEGPLRLALVDVDVHVTDEQWASLRPHFYAAIDRIVIPRIGAKGTLETLKAVGCKIGLISNTYWAADLHDRHLAQHGLIDLFDVRVYSCNAPHCKPHRSIFLDTLALIRIAPHDAVYVGDRPDLDVLGAQRAGMYGILIRSPYDHTPVGNVGPDAIIDELPDLIPALERLETPV